MTGPCGSSMASGSPQAPGVLELWFRTVNHHLLHRQCAKVRVPLATVGTAFD